MSLADAFDLEGDRKCVYRYVERHGPVDPSLAARATETDPESFHHHVAMLRRDGLLEETDDGRLRVAVHPGETEEFEEAGVSYEIRPARQADLTGLVGVIRQVAGQTSVAAEQVAEEIAYEDTVVRRTPTQSRVAFVATVSGDVVGWSHVGVAEHPKLSGTATLTAGVVEGYRRHGIGSHLLQRGVAWAASRGCRKVYDSLPATNEAGLAFLEANGWHVEARRPDHYEIDGKLVDEVMLARTLDD
jgi:ribosomal protein S18 acetylase RimI-like enzyme